MRLAFSVAAPATERLDRFLADQLSLSRTQAARLVADGRVTVGGRLARASRVLARGEAVAVDLPDAEPPRTLAPVHIPLTVVYEDEHVAVIDKPAGLVVHPAPGHWGDTLVNALVARGTTLAGGAEGRPGIVHRLDRDTSGLLVVARTDRAHRALGAMIAARRVTRRYAALAWGHLDASPLRIEAPLGRHATERKRMVVRPDGRAALSEVRVLARFDVAELLRVDLFTGRTHQIRVHLAHVGHPVVGDPVYGGGGSRRISGESRLAAAELERLVPRQALHAAVLAFRHPVSGAPLRFVSPWPADLRAALDWLGERAGVSPPADGGYLLMAEDDG